MTDPKNRPTLHPVHLTADQIRVLAKYAGRITISEVAVFDAKDLHSAVHGLRMHDRELNGK